MSNLRFMNIKKKLYKLFLFLGIILTFGLISVFVLVNNSLPQDNGELSCSFLKSEVNIYKDNWGIPHIEAANEHDAIFAYGYTVAKDRLFQMDLQRRLSQGRLAEILGDDLIEIDAMFRTYLFKNWSENYIKDSTINSSALAYVDAYIEGVNYFIATGPKPIEYHLIGAEIKPFNRVDVTSMIAYMAFTFMDGIRFDGLYSILKEKIGENNLEILFPDYADNNHLTIKEEKVDSIPSRDYKKDSAANLTSSLNQLSYFFDLNKKSEQWNPPFHGSNSWILGPSRTNTGKPILANDPHIGISKPDVWYEAHISYPGYNNYGYYVPMIPFPLIGHDQFKAWGLTMFENDELDLYKETFHPDKDNLVRYNNQWVEYQSIYDTIFNKEQKDTVIQIKVTSHGPIVTDNIPYYNGDPIAMFWVFYQQKNPIFDILYQLSHSMDMKTFEDNLSNLVSPGLNFSYIDTTGNIAWWASGKIPYRHSSINAKEILDGNNPKHEVISYVPFEDNPHLVNPPNGVIVTANNLSTIDSVGNIPRLDGYFRSTDRAERILELLTTKDTWTVEELQLVQTDVKLWSGPKMNEILFKSLEKKQSSFNLLENEAFSKLTNWNAQMTTSSIGTSVFMFTNYHIMKNLIGDSLDKESVRLYLNIIDHWDFYKLFLYQNITPFNNNADFDEIVLQGFKDAVNELETKFGSSIKSWSWGDVHQIEFEHPLGKQKPLNLLFNLGPYGVNGGFNAVNKIMSHQGDHTYKVSSLPSTRRLINLGDQKNSFSILPSGNSGHFQSDHYDDQLDLFLNGEYRKLNYTSTQIQSNKKKHFKLTPIGK